MFGNLFDEALNEPPKMDVVDFLRARLDEEQNLAEDVKRLHVLFQAEGDWPGHQSASTDGPVVIHSNDRIGPLTSLATV